MPNYKAKGLVIKSYRLGETDKIIKIFTPGSGLISAVAKGAYNIKSKFSGRLELYNIIDGEFSLGKSLDIISQAETIEFFDNISKDFLKYNYSQLISELILKTQTEKAPSYNLFKLTYLVIKKINEIEHENELSLQLLLVFYMINFSKITGHVPMLDCCTVCGKNLFEKHYDRRGNADPAESIVYHVAGNENSCKPSLLFSINFGGLVCKSCSPGLKNTKFLNSEKAAFFKKLFSCRLEELKNLKADSDTVKDLLELMLQYISFHLETTLASYAYLKKIHKNLLKQD